MDLARVGAMDHHHRRHLRNVIYEPGVGGHQQVGSFQQGKEAFQGGFLAPKTLTATVGEMLEMDPPTGVVINPRCIANGGTNPAQSVVMTRSNRVTVWMERAA